MFPILRSSLLYAVSERVPVADTVLTCIFSGRRQEAAQSESGPRIMLTETVIECDADADDLELEQVYVSNGRCIALLSWHALKSK